MSGCNLLTVTFSWIVFCLVTWNITNPAYKLHWDRVTTKHRLECLPWVKWKSFLLRLLSSMLQCCICNMHGVFYLSLSGGWPHFPNQSTRKSSIPMPIAGLIVDTLHILWYENYLLNQDKKKDFFLHMFTLIRLPRWHFVTYTICITEIWKTWNGVVEQLNLSWLSDIATKLADV